MQYANLIRDNNDIDTRLYNQLLTNTEILEDITQDLVGGDLTRDLTQEVQYFADVLSQQIGG